MRISVEEVCASVSGSGEVANTEWEVSVLMNASISAQVFYERNVGVSEHTPTYKGKEKRTIVVPPSCGVQLIYVTALKNGEPGSMNHTSPSSSDTLSGL